MELAVLRDQVFVRGEQHSMAEGVRGGFQNGENHSPNTPVPHAHAILLAQLRFGS